MDILLYVKRIYLENKSKTCYYIDVERKGIT